MDTDRGDRLGLGGEKPLVLVFCCESGHGATPYGQPGYTPPYGGNPYAQYGFGLPEGFSARLETCW